MLREDGFYFEVFPPIVRYCRELLPREAEVSKKKDSMVLPGWKTKTGTSLKSIDIHVFGY